ncbi:MAG: helix-turn-helix domain-containing protein, partial [Chlorobiaceae bacterium]|nr:helix-turn-helix domain-containing protein [Chlorobiaceae bacterium]
MKLVRIITDRVTGEGFTQSGLPQASLTIWRYEPMTISNMKEKIDNLLSKEPSRWMEKASSDEANEARLERSSNIALPILGALQLNGMSQKELTEKIGVSPQLVNKILKGKENLTLETIDQLEIYGGKNALDRIRDLLYGVVLRNTPAPMPISFIPVSKGVIIEDGDLTISAFNVQHRGPDCLGFVFEEKGRRPFMPEKAEALGIPAGPWRRDLVDGTPVT